MTRGRKRRHDPTIPSHVDQNKLPVGCYWDRRDRVWYTIHYGVKAKRQRIAGADAMLSDLHGAMERLRGVNRKSMDWLFQQYHVSHVFKALAESTQKAYLVQREVALAQPTKIGKSFGELDFTRLETKHFQALVDRLADEGTPTKANALMRYLKLVYSWAKRRGHVKDNPVKGVQQATERQRRRLPDPATMAGLIKYAAAGGRLTPHSEGSCPPYLWAAADIGYLCRLRGIEVITLSDAHVLENGLKTNRRKGSRDNIVAWTPRLRAAVDALINRRDTLWARRKMPVPMRAKDRPLIVSEDGAALGKSSLDSAWQRLLQRAIKDGVIEEEMRFGFHDLKRRGVTDTEGTRADKQDASGHKSASMMDVYDHSVPVVRPAKPY